MKCGFPALLLFAACATAPAPHLQPAPTAPTASPAASPAAPTAIVEGDADVVERARDIERLVMLGDCAEAVAEAEEYLRQHSADGGVQEEAQRDIYESYVRCQDELEEAGEPP